MELTTLLFLGFFAAVALLNYTLPRVLRPYCLLAASYLFYCWGANDRLLVPVLVAATLVTWGCGLVIGKCRIGPVRVIFLLLAVFTCVGLLFYYKYNISFFYKILCVIQIIFKVICTFCA